MLDEISQRGKDKYCMISLKNEIYKTEQNKTKNWAHGYREQIGGFQSGGPGCKMGEGG